MKKSGELVKLQSEKVKKHGEKIVGKGANLVKAQSSLLKEQGEKLVGKGSDMVKIQGSKMKEQGGKIIGKGSDMLKTQNTMIKNKSKKIKAQGKQITAKGSKMMKVHALKMQKIPTAMIKRANAFAPHIKVSSVATNVVRKAKVKSMEASRHVLGNLPFKKTARTLTSSRKWEIAIVCQNPSDCTPVVNKLKRIKDLQYHTCSNVVLVNSEYDLLLEADYEMVVARWIHSAGKGTCPDHDEFLAGRKLITLTPCERIMSLMHILRQHLGISDMKEVVRLVPLHDAHANISFILQYDIKRLGLLDDTAINKIRNHFGDEVGFYYAWMSHINQWLLPLGIIGGAIQLTIFIKGVKIYEYLLPFYSLVVICWAHLLVQYWLQEESKLVHRWNLEDIPPLGEVRDDFKGELKSLGDDDEGKPILDSEFTVTKRLPKFAVTFPFSLVLLAFVLCGAYYAFKFEVYIWYTEPGKELKEDAGFFGFVVGALPDILFGLVFDEGMWAIFIPIAMKLSQYENYKFQRHFQNSVIYKMYAFYFLSIFVYYFCVAFIYIPFGKSFFNDYLEWEAKVDVEKGRFQQLIRNTFLTTQLAKLIAKTLLPLVLHKLGAEAQKQASHMKRVTARVGRNKILDEGVASAKSIDQTEASILEEVKRSEYHTFIDYAESAAQFTKLVFFSCVFPAAPLAALGTNIIEQHLDMFSISYHHRRPIPVRRNSIGGWLYIFKFAASLSSFVNVAIIMLTMNYFHDSWLATFSSILPPGCTNCWEFNMYRGFALSVLVEKALQLVASFLPILLPEKAAQVSRIERYNILHFERAYNRQHSSFMSDSNFYATTDVESGDEQREDTFTSVEASEDDDAMSVTGDDEGAVLIEDENDVMGAEEIDEDEEEAQFDAIEEISIDEEEEKASRFTPIEEYDETP